jgi:hypothetical protein
MATTSQNEAARELLLYASADALVKSENGKASGGLGGI